MSYIDKWVQKEICDTLEKILDDIHAYELDCRFADDKDECSQCNDNVFGSIYRIIHKYKKGVTNDSDRDANNGDNTDKSSRQSRNG